MARSLVFFNRPIFITVSAVTCWGAGRPTSQAHILRTPVLMVLSGGP